ncbi:MAG: polyprenol monophosphomannose synthase [bacterium]|nr:polyprenol monophosphomannose synthase [bacterium]
MTAARKALIVIGTYNERENIRELVERVLGLALGFHILIIDDNSPDGTGRIADELADAHPEVGVIHRPSKMGLGTAYLAGFRHGIERGYDLLLTMDADFSHDPAVLPRLLEAAETHDLVIGSRYVRGGGVVNWPWHRKLVSRGGSIYARLVTGLPVADATGGFNCYRSEVLRAIGLDGIRSEGYAFHIEMKHKARRKGFRICEIPITFVDRTLGKSKMSKRIFLEAIGRCWKIRFSGRDRSPSPPARTGRGRAS